MTPSFLAFLKYIRFWKCFEEMQLNGVVADWYTHTIFVHGLCKNGCILQAVDLFRDIRNNEWELSAETRNCIIYIFNRCGLAREEWN